MAFQYSRGRYSRGIVAALIGVAGLSLVPGWTGQGIAVVPAAVSSTSVPKVAPEFSVSAPEAWINSRPLHVADLQGKVVLLNFWTSDCSNCTRSLAWVKHLEELFGRLGFQVIGIHSPEFAAERDGAKLAAKIAEHNLTYPIMVDNDLSYWKSIGNRSWPAFYIIDRKGEIRGVFTGETRIGDARAEDIEHLIQTLIAQG